MVVLPRVSGFRCKEIQPMKFEDVEKVIDSVRRDPRLRLLGDGGAGILELEHRGFAPIKIDLKKRYVRLLQILATALVKDRDLERRERGWLTDERIADLYTADDPKALPLAAETIASYRAHITGKIRSLATAENATATPPPFILTVRNLGVRLVRELEIARS